MKRALAAIVLLASPAQAQVISGTATVVDGDTLNLTGMSVRLFGIDAPEAGQTCERSGEVWQCGSDAAALLSELIAGRPVSCQQRDLDGYGRTVATCSAGRLDLAGAMVSAGYAVSLPNFSSDYVESEARARSQQLGIWTSVFQTPAEYRAAYPAPSRQVANTASSRVTDAPDAPTNTVYYRNCNEARAAGAAPLYRGQLGYRAQMDGDNDGVACEPYRGGR